MKEQSKNINKCACTTLLCWRSFAVNMELLAEKVIYELLNYLAPLEAGLTGLLMSHRQHCIQLSRVQIISFREYDGRYNTELANLVVASTFSGTTAHNRIKGLLLNSCLCFMILRHVRDQNTEDNNNEMSMNSLINKLQYKKSVVLYLNESWRAISKDSMDSIQKQH